MNQVNQKRAVSILDLVMIMAALIAGIALAILAYMEAKTPMFAFMWPLLAAIVAYRQRAE